MQFNTKKFLIIFIIIVSTFNQSKLFAQSKADFNDFGIISIMYHRFDESKYPSTNIQLDVFKEQIKIIESENIKFVDPKKFKELLNNNKKERKVLLTIDDGLLSFYKTWPILKQKEIPFILFVNTREVGSFNYMDWDQIKDVSNSEFVTIGNHSHSHEYLVEETPEKIKEDLITSKKLFKKKFRKKF